MHTLKQYHLPFADATTLAPFGTGQTEKPMRYRGVAYRPGELPKAVLGTGAPMIYRSVRYNLPLAKSHTAPVPSQRRYRGVAY